MFEAADFRRVLDRLGADYYVGVPDTVIKNLCNSLVSDPPRGGHVIAANEGGAVGMAAGHYLATGAIPVVYMQNSGIGNAVNPLLSLADREVYAIPMLLLIGWRGEPGRKDEPQHIKQGRISLALLQSLEIPVGVIGPDLGQATAELEKAFAAMRAQPGPYALMIRNDCFAPTAAEPAGHAGVDAAFTREEAIRIAMTVFGDQASFVASTGMGSRELFELREAAGQPHGLDFLNVGAMGHASQIAAALAAAKPGRTAVCLDGDGAFFMHMGGVALAPRVGGARFVHILLNNGVHDSVGGQPNLAMKIPPSDVATVCGYGFVREVDNPGDLRDILLGIRDNGTEGPYFIEVKVARGYRKNLGRPTIPFAEATRQFRECMERT